MLHTLLMIEHYH